jgi:hypothetical protein
MEGCYKLDMSKFGAWFAECLESRNGSIIGLVADEDTTTDENEDIVVDSQPAKRVKKICEPFDEKLMSPLQKTLGCITTKSSARKFSFEDFISNCEKYNPIADETNPFLKFFEHRMKTLGLELLDWKKRTITGIRKIQEPMPLPIFMKLFWNKARTKWACSKK